MAEENNNLKLYELLRVVPQEAKKQFNNGRFSGTDINPMWRIKRLTEIFGPCGIGWYYDVVRREIVEASNGTKCAFVATNLYIMTKEGWSKPIYGEGGNTFESNTKSGSTTVSDEAYKMALTDAISISAKQLGLGADVWYENDKQHGTKYDNKSVADSVKSLEENNAQGEKKVQPSNSTTQQPTQPTTAQKEPSAQPAQKTASTKKIKVELAVDKENLTDEQKKFVKDMQAWVRSLPQEAINNLVSFTNKAVADWTYMDYVTISQSNQQ